MQSGPVRASILFLPADTRQRFLIRPAKRIHDAPGIDFTSRHPDVTPFVTTRTLMRRSAPWPGEARLGFIPTSLYCYMVGHRAVRDPAADAPWEVTAGC